MNEYVICAECRFVVTAESEDEARKMLSLGNQEFDYLEVEQITSIELEVD